MPVTAFAFHFMCTGHAVDFGVPVTFKGAPLTIVKEHKWLGILWPANLDFRSVLIARLKQCSVIVAQLAGLIRMGTLTWAVAQELFESKVDSVMALGRWVFIMVNDAEEFICSGPPSV